MLIAKTIPLLGVVNIFRVVLYKVKLKLGLFNPLATPVATGPFFLEKNIVSLPSNLADLNSSVKGFDHILIDENCIPDWHLNILTHQESQNKQVSWQKVGDFDCALGDIKGCWELSRFSWLVVFALRARAGDVSAIKTMNTWLADWVNNNQLFKGVNWKCGQEASIRVIHLIFTAVLLNQDKSAPASLVSLVAAHLARISPSISYAIGQANNHGTSEASALYIGGSWLNMHGQSIGGKYQKQGAYWLENRAHKLIMPDGTFSQYSTNYHRLMLDTYTLAEVWRTRHHLTSFSNNTYRQLQKATQWLATMVQPETGHVPIVGANDGARLFPVNDSYLDFRPSVQTAMSLFSNRQFISTDGPWNNTVKLLNIELPKQQYQQQESQIFKDGGFFVQHLGKSFILLNYPNYQFRPSHNDALHLDFWVNGQNLLMDGGTFSYNESKDNLAYYSGVKSHNVIQFDNREQMQPISRFLWAKWPSGNLQKIDDNTISSESIDYDGARHSRAVSLDEHKLIVVDEISGFKKKAVVRWRLSPGNWAIEGTKISTPEHCIEIDADVNIDRIALVQGNVSRYYYQQEAIPVLEIELSQSGVVTTTYNYNK